ncbi:MAG: fasciclin domain-containing protein [Bacteroidetes bacterium]|nr:fasciclin domain-containing protein [Bacteroidota bacterium]
MKNNFLYGMRAVVVFAALLLIEPACKKDLNFSYQVQDRKVLLFDMLKQDTSMSIAVAALEKASKPKYDSAHGVSVSLTLAAALDSYGPYTFFAPDNNAFRKYFAVRGKKGLDDFPDSTIYDLMNYHILPTRLQASDFIQGPQATTTGAGDYLSIDISKGYKSQAIANGVARIYQTDLTYYNGYVHKLDAVLDPPTLTIGEFLKNNPDKYSILIAGLTKAGLMDTISSLTNAAGVRNRLTLFAETNDVLQKAGIQSFDNLPMDSLVRLMRNHLAPGQNSSSSYTHLTAAIPALNIIQRWDSTLMTIDQQDWIYFDLAAPHLIDGSTDFAASDIGARNGLIHNVSQPLAFPATKKRTQIYHIFWSSTNYCYGIPGFANGNSTPAANASSGNWRYYFESAAGNMLFVNPDGVGDSMVTVVRNVRKGKYQLTVNDKNGGRGTFQLYYGADTIGPPVNYSFAGLPQFRQNYVIGTYDFKTSGDKRLNFVCTAVGGLNLECLILTPVY